MFLAGRRAPGALLTGLPLPELAFTKLPLLANTIPVRYSLYVTLFAGLVLAIILDRLHAAVRARSHRVHSRRRSPAPFAAWAAFALLAAVCLVPLIPNGPITGVTEVVTPSYFTSPTMAARPAAR